MLASLNTNTVLGSAGPRYSRGDGIPLTGLMEFDIADVQGLINEGRFDALILHEMGVSSFTVIVVNIIFQYANGILCSLMM